LTTSTSCRALVLLIALAAARPALAQDGSGNDREVAARGLFAEGRYRDALDLYVKLYAETAHPTYLRNIGRCYQNLGEAEKATASFREYLRQATDLTFDQRMKIEGYIREMEEATRSHAQSSEPRVAAPPVPGNVPPAGETAAQRSDVGSTIGATPEPDSGSFRRGVALGISAVGLVGVGVGTWFGLDARSQWISATALCPAPHVTGCSEPARQLGDDAERSALAATILIPAGALALAAGVILWLTSPEYPKPAAMARFRIVPQLPYLPQAGGGMFTGGISGTF
jgi:tetratricopeptide (TPR) repeat protein